MHLVICQVTVACQHEVAVVQEAQSTLHVAAACEARCEARCAMPRSTLLALQVSNQGGATSTFETTALTHGGTVPPACEGAGCIMQLSSVCMASKQRRSVP